MGKKKKQETQNSVNSFTYQGNITLSVVKDKKTLFTKKYTNNGYNDLFKFLCNCLAGNFDKNSLPQKIVLFTGTADEKVAEPEFDPEKKLTEPISINTAPVITYTEAEGYKTVYRFSIPYAYIIGNNDIKIYKAALVKNSLTTYESKDNLSASYLFITENAAGERSWAPIPIEKAAGNFSLVIQWELAIKN